MMEGIITQPQYKDLLDMVFTDYPDYRQNFYDLISQYNFTNSVPKGGLFVKLDPSITQQRRDFVANGIRSFFRTPTTVLFDMKVEKDALDQAVNVLNIMVLVVGAISFILAFFLLLVSTTTNIRENVWEYGCLRSMGLTKSEGMRCFLHEQYTLILSSLLLGTFVGFLLSCMVTSQFFLFIQLPFKLEFPWYILITMIVMALVTTLLAVVIPVRSVNKKKIATVIKGSAS